MRQYKATQLTATLTNAEEMLRNNLKDLCQFPQEIDLFLIGTETDQSSRKKSVS